MELRQPVSLVHLAQLHLRASELRRQGGFQLLQHSSERSQERWELQLKARCSEDRRWEEVSERRQQALEHLPTQVDSVVRQLHLEVLHSVAPQRQGPLDYSVSREPGLEGLLLLHLALSELLTEDSEGEIPVRQALELRPLPLVDKQWEGMEELASEVLLRLVLELLLRLHSELLLEVSDNQRLIPPLQEALERHRALLEVLALAQHLALVLLQPQQAFLARVQVVPLEEQRLQGSVLLVQVSAVLRLPQGSEERLPIPL